jgi:hypothetical protein
MTTVNIPSGGAAQDLVRSLTDAFKTKTVRYHCEFG